MLIINLFSVYRVLIPLTVFILRKDISASAERISKKIYIDLKHTSACFRRLNATGQFGCASDLSGNRGVVYVVGNDTDMSWLLEHGPNAPYIVMIHPTLFNRMMVKTLKDSRKVVGIMIVHYNLERHGFPIPKEFSLDSWCPLDSYGLYANDSRYAGCRKAVWNPGGNSMLYEDFGLPIFLITNETDGDAIVQKCYKTWNERVSDAAPRTYPLCEAELRSGMYAATDTVTCLRRSNHAANLNPQKYCDRLGDFNVYATVQRLNRSQERQPRSVVVAATRIDTTSIFESVAPGADNGVSGVVALLATALALKSSGGLEAIARSDKDLLFAFLHGETYDYIGSSRMVYDMQRDAFPYIVNTDNDENGLPPINLTHLSHFIEVDQVGHSDVGAWIHSDPISRQRPNIAEEIENITAYMEQEARTVGLNVSRVRRSQPLPPASVQRFLMKHALPAVVLTDHESSFTNKYYNSRFDLARSVNGDYPPHLNQSERYDYVTELAKTLTNVATLLARTLLSVAIPSHSINNVFANETEVAHLLNCFLYDSRCRLFKIVSLPENVKHLPADGTPLPLYVGVNTNSTIYASTMITSVLTYYTGDVMRGMTKDECTKSRKNKMVKYMWMQGSGIPNISGVCIASMVGLSAAVSPAFIIDDYDWTSGEYSTWTESVWETTSVRLFLVPSKQFQIANLLAGVAVLVVSHIVIYFLNRKITVILGNDLSTTGESASPTSNT